MVLPICHETFITVGDGTATNRKTKGANPRIPKGLAVVWICVEQPNGKPAVSVVVHIVVSGKPVELAAKWVRGPSIHGGAGALIKGLYFPIPQDTTFFVSIRNDTGAEQKLTFHWVTEPMRGAA